MPEIKVVPTTQPQNDLLDSFARELKRNRQQKAEHSPLLNDTIGSTLGSRQKQTDLQFIVPGNTGALAVWPSSPLYNRLIEARRAGLDVSFENSFENAMRAPALRIADQLNGKSSVLIPLVDERAAAAKLPVPNRVMIPHSKADTGVLFKAPNNQDARAEAAFKTLKESVEKIYRRGLEISISDEGGHALHVSPHRRIGRGPEKRYPFASDEQLLQRLEGILKVSPAALFEDANNSWFFRAREAAGSFGSGVNTGGVILNGPRTPGVRASVQPFRPSGGSDPRVSIDSSSSGRVGGTVIDGQKRE